MARALALVVAAWCASASAEPVRVTVGVRLRDAGALDLQQSAYSLAFTYWLRWRGPADAVNGLRFVNTLDGWALTQTPAFEAPVELPDGSRYQRILVEGRFTNRLHLDDFPFDTQVLAVELEEQAASSEQLELVADPGSSAPPVLSLQGWTVGGLTQEVAVERHPLGLDAPLGVSRYRFGLEVRRPPSVFFLNLAPPLLLVLLCCWAIFFLRPQHVDARIGTVITALLTIVFLDLAYTDDVPYLPGLVLIDQLFNYSYVVLTAMLLACVAVVRWNDQALELAGQPAAAALRARIERLDTWARRGFPLVYLLGCGVIMLLGRR